MRIVEHDEIVSSTVTVRLIENKASKGKERGYVVILESIFQGEGRGKCHEGKIVPVVEERLGWFTCLV